MSNVLEQDNQQIIRDLYEATQKAAEEYQACCTTTIYGDTYLDPEKCKARDQLRKNLKRIRLSAEWVDRTANEKGFLTMYKELIDQTPKQFVNKRPNFSNFDGLDDFPKKKIRSLMIKASYLVGRKIKLEDKLYVKVIAVKMNDDGVFLEAEEKVGDKLEYYEITLNSAIENTCSLMNFPTIITIMLPSFSTHYLHSLTDLNGCVYILFTSISLISLSVSESSLSERIKISLSPFSNLEIET
ncbi:4466_t:CDS:2 [Funneliformis mosseae]|uniref:4466_t:CDS:1 n=1 Tax=Funneliformis mosseae TaxID=27381 RepID=A0A9N9GP01_FUNMO|nr:4466_t:CDS:2 [Funneliformis mosseae]